MTDSTARRKRATYPMSFKLDLVHLSLPPGASGALLAREHGINDNLLFTWRQRYRHLFDAPADDGAGESVVINDNIVPVVLERQPSSLPTASPALAPVSPSKPGQVCEIIIGRARLKLSGNLTTAMLATLFAVLMKGFLRTDLYKCILCGDRLRFTGAQAGRHATELLSERLYGLARKRWLRTEAAG